jgi:hypothetical protein
MVLTVLGERGSGSGELQVMLSGGGSRGCRLRPRREFVPRKKRLLFFVFTIKSFCIQLVSR